jgi:hypothetical protein
MRTDWLLEAPEQSFYFLPLPIVFQKEINLRDYFYFILFKIQVYPKGLHLLVNKMDRSHGIWRKI